MPLISSSNCRVLQCGIWKTTYLYTCLLSKLVCPILVDILLCKAESHSFVQEFVDFYTCNGECHGFEPFFTEYFGMPYICRYLNGVTRNTNHLSSNFSVLQCVMRKATIFYTCLLGMLICLTFVAI